METAIGRFVKQEKCLKVPLLNFISAKINEYGNSTNLLLIEPEKSQTGVLPKVVELGGARQECASGRNSAPQRKSDCENAFLRRNCPLGSRWTLS